MAMTPSNMTQLGQPIPDFSLTNVTDSSLIRSKELIGEKPILVMFICNHCPFVIHVRNQLAKLGNEYLKKGVAVVGVYSYEIAETKVTQVMDFAQRHQHPLQCTMEKE